jgi:hypothetical protein
VLGETNLNLGNQNGTDTNPITGSITLAPVAEAYSVTVTDIVAATGATVALFSDTNLADTETSIPVALADITDVYIRVTAQDTTTILYYKVSIDQPEVVTSAYKLKTSESDSAGNAASGLTLLTAAKDAAGVVTIKLTGSLAAKYKAAVSGGNVTPVDGFTATDWGTPVQAANGTYAGMYITGAVSSNGWQNAAIKQFNQALRFYTGHQDLTLAEAPANPLKDDAGASNIYVPVATDPAAWPITIKWKLHQSLASTTTLSFLLWSGAPVKTVTFVVEQYNEAGTTKSGDIATIIVDYSGVTF